MSKVSGRDILLGVLTFSMLCVVIKILIGSTSVDPKQGPEGPPGPAGPPAPLGATGIPGLSPYIVTGPVANSLKINQTGGLYYTIPAFGYFKYSGTNTTLAANTPLPFVTVSSRSGAGVVGNSAGVITMGIVGWYRITFSCTVSPATPNVPTEGFYLYKNSEPQTFQYTALNTRDTTNVLNCIVQLTKTTDTISVSYNQSFNFGTSTYGFMSIDFISM